MSATPVGSPGTTPPDPFALVRSRKYAVLLVIAALLGIPISAAAFGFLALVSELQSLTYTDLPRGLGFDGTPSWWPIPLLALAGLLVALSIRYLPGKGGHKPAEGLVAKGAPSAAELPSVALAAVASLSAGVVLGPEAPLIALGGGLAVLSIRALKRDVQPNAIAVLGAAGSFAAVSTLLGSPLLGAFLLMEAAGIGGVMMGVVLVPGLLAAGVGALIFTGLGSWTGLGTYSLVIAHVPAAGRPDVAGFGWAVAIGVAAALLGAAIRRPALLLQAHVDRRRIPLTVLTGVLVGVVALVYAEWTGRAASGVMYSGQSALGPLLADQAGYTAGTLVILVVCKALAYSLSLGAFRGGPVFPSMFVGAAGGLAMAHLPGLDVTSGFAMGVGAMCVAMLKLPMTAVLLATLLLGTQGITVMPLVIVAVVVSYVLSLRLTPAPPPSPVPDVGPR
ncbi:chloride channel protein [Streptomyces sp. NBC_00687]|uniref:chloride channel protein n=1 Tax=Streptomyces sp. NBC_00687 TaxID=2975807 RepID=UPI002253335E|nr:chloride channel protein [Streptomyces sp. NBC_00687]MCX4912685.1 chloride channel protein [Streptomyces sp. NBC_00687]